MLHYYDRFVPGAAPRGVTRFLLTAAAIGVLFKEHNLGLTCDPIGGLVQVPCIERNAVASITAINAVRIALRGDGRHFVSVDKAINTMRITGHDMLDKYTNTRRRRVAAWPSTS